MQIYINIYIIYVGKSYMRIRSCRMQCYLLYLFIYNAIYIYRQL